MKRGGTALGATDYENEATLREAVARKDAAALTTLGIGVTADSGKLREWARRLDQGRSLFFGKASLAVTSVTAAITSPTTSSITWASASPPA
jgi:hypothetical protein